MNIDQILGKVFADKATREELQALEAWKQEASENINALKQMQTIDKALQDVAEYKQYDVEKAWTKVEQRLGNIENTDAKVVSFSWVRYVAAASVIMLMSLVGLNYMMNDQDTQLKTYVSNTQKMNTTLSDGSNIMLDKESEIVADALRSVTLNGTAFFDIAKMDGDKFTVDLPHGKITVLGTQFVVNTKESKVKIYVTEGKVMYELDGRKVTLAAGDQLIMHNGDINKFKSDGEEMMGWMSTKLTFRNEPLANVITALNKNYNVNLVIDSPKQAQNCKLTTTFKSENINEILNELSLTLGLKYQTIEGVIHIVEANC